MEFIDKWREQVSETLTECAKLAVGIQEVDLEYALMATAVLWPLKQPVQDFDMEAIEAVNKILGRQAKHVLRVVQDWDDDLMEAARSLSAEVTDNNELDAALDVLIKHFRAFFIFAEELSKQRGQDSPTAPDGVNAVTDISLAVPGVEGVGETSVQPPRVFISYARSDGEDLARELQQRLEREGIPVWQDRAMMQAGRDWWLQIIEALNQVKFMVLVTTPAALRSEIVRKEWQYARQQGVCVYPVKGVADMNLTDLPRWMQHVHFYNLELEWPKLVKDLNAPCETPRVPFMVEELPDDYVPRSEQLNQLLALVLDEKREAPVATTVALHGTGGYGKSMLAQVVCHDEDVREAFDEGILWVTLGEDPGDLTGRVVDLVEVLSGERPGFANLDAAEARLAELLADRDILLVIDDVWDMTHLKPFIRGGPRCARLITTRNVTVLPPQTLSIEVGAMERHEAVTLLGMGLPRGDLKSLQKLAARLGEWPLLLKLVNGTLRDRVHKNNQPLPAALAYVDKALQKRGLTAFDAHNAAARDQAVSQTLGVSQDLLEEDERDRYGELAIFPGDVNIPLTVLEKLWGATGGLNKFDTEALCDRLFQLSLISYFDPNNGYITLHNIVRKYLAQVQGDKLVGLHNQLLNACAVDLPTDEAGQHQWVDLPHHEAYLWAHLAYHLVQAERGAELVNTVKDFHYLTVKAYLRYPYAAEADLLAARQVAPNDTGLTRLHQAFSQSSHLIGKCKTLSGIANTLHSRTTHISGLTELVTAGEANLPKPLLTARYRLPDLPDSSLIRTLTGHGVAVSDCAMSADGSTIVSFAADTILKIWDVHTGAERFTLTGHRMIGSTCAISADGSVVVSGAWDGVLKIWDANDSTERLSIKAHLAPVFDCAISADGTIVVSASKDKTLKVWDAYTGAERFTLTGHERSVTGCDISADGTIIVSVSLDGTVKIWETASGTLRATSKAFELTETHNPALGLTFTASTSSMASCAISADKTTIVSTVPDGTLKVWDTDAATERLTLKGHSVWVDGCAINADGSLIVSASNDKTLKGWDGHTGAECFMLEGHLRAVTGCAVSADGTTIASASQDKTIKLWDTENVADQSALASHISAAQSCDVSVDGQTMVCDSPGNALKVLDAQTGTERCVLKGHMRPVTGCVINSDGTVIVSASQDRTIKIWDAQNGTERLTLRGHMWAVNDCVLSSDGRIIVSASDDSTLKVWDAHVGTERFTLAGHMRGVNSCAISPDNTFIASASADKTLKIWDAHTGADRLTLTGHDAPVNGCAISPDGSLIVSISSDDTLKLWDSQTGAEHLTMEGHTDTVLGCAFSPDGRFILSVSKDRSLKLWDTQSGRCLTTLYVDGSLVDCVWFPDGQHLVTVGARGVYFLRLVQ